jgi:hypothetical protein
MFQQIVAGQRGRRHGEKGGCADTCRNKATARHDRQLRGGLFHGVTIAKARAVGNADSQLMKPVPAQWSAAFSSAKTAQCGAQVR